jgi:hypothetical protein
VACYSRSVRTPTGRITELPTCHTRAENVVSKYFVPLVPKYDGGKKYLFLTICGSQRVVSYWSHGSSHHTD